MYLSEDIKINFDFFEIVTKQINSFTFFLYPYHQCVKKILRQVNEKKKILIKVHSKLY